MKNNVWFYLIQLIQNINKKTGLLLCSAIQRCKMMKHLLRMVTKTCHFIVKNESVVIKMNAFYESDKRTISNWVYIIGSDRHCCCASNYHIVCDDWNLSEAILLSNHRVSWSWLWFCYGLSFAIGSKDGGFCGLSVSLIYGFDGSLLPPSTLYYISSVALCL